MNKYIKALFVAIAVVAIAGCAKDIDFSSVPVPGSGCRLTTMKIDAGAGDKSEGSFTYDGDGKLIKTTDITASEFTTFTYTANKITILDSWGDQTDITLAGGKAVSSIIHSSFGADQKKEYSYNTDGYLSGVKNYFGTDLVTTDELTYANGNLSQSKRTDATTGDVLTITYQYSTDIAKNVYEMFDPIADHVDYIPGGYFGKSSKNIMSNLTGILTDAGGTKKSDLIVKNTYVFNTIGNATSLTSYTKETDVSGFMAEFTLKFELGYTCK